MPDNKTIMLIATDAIQRMRDACDDIERAKNSLGYAIRQDEKQKGGSDATEKTKKPRRN